MYRNNKCNQYLEHEIYSNRKKSLNTRSNRTGKNLKLTQRHLSFFGPKIYNEIPSKLKTIEVVTTILSYHNFDIK